MYNLFTKNSKLISISIKLFSIIVVNNFNVNKFKEYRAKQRVSLPIFLSG